MIKRLLKWLYKPKKQDNRYQLVGKLVHVELSRNREFRRSISKLPTGQDIIKILNSL